VFGLLRLKLVEPPCQFIVRGEHLPQPDKGSHNLDAGGHSNGSVEHAGEHDLLAPNERYGAFDPLDRNDGLPFYVCLRRLALASQSLLSIDGAGDGTRTRTVLSDPGILSPSQPVFRVHPLSSLFARKACK